MEENIYQAPKSDISIQINYSDYELATTGKRFANMLLDFVFYLMFSFIVGTAFTLAGAGDSIANVNDNLLGIILITLYYFPQEAIWGRTLGKLVTNTKVVTLDGKKASFLQALGRTFCRFIPFEAFTFLGGKGKPHGLHDRLPKTKVISLNKKHALAEEVSVNNKMDMLEIIETTEGEFSVGERCFKSRKDAKDFLALLKGLQ